MNGSSIDGRTYLKTELAGAANLHCLTVSIVPQTRKICNPPRPALVLTLRCK
jgi:hypothetical protein